MILCACCALFSCSDVLDSCFLNAEIFVDSDAAVADRCLCQKSDLYDTVNGKMELSHHIEVFAVCGVVECKIVSHSCDLEPRCVAI